MHNSLVVFTFSFLDGKSPFWANIVQKLKLLVKLKFGTWTNSNMQNSMAIFVFSIFDRKCSLWANLVQKFKIAQTKI